MVNNIRYRRVLRRKSDFEALRKYGRRFSSTKWCVLVYRKNDAGTVRFGVTVSGKVSGAVVRNRLKRWCREYFRSMTSKQNVGVDINVVFKPVSFDFYKKLSSKDVSAVLDSFFIER